eukprot:789715-Rhodomonas_salina.3
MFVKADQRGRVCDREGRGAGVGLGVYASYALRVVTCRLALVELVEVVHLSLALLQHFRVPLLHLVSANSGPQPAQRLCRTTCKEKRTQPRPRRFRCRWRTAHSPGGRSGLRGGGRADRAASPGSSTTAVNTGHRRAHARGRYPEQHVERRALHSFAAAVWMHGAAPKED